MIASQTNTVSISDYDREVDQERERRNEKVSLTHSVTTPWLMQHQTIPTDRIEDTLNKHLSSQMQKVRQAKYWSNSDLPNCEDCSE